MDARPTWPLGPGGEYQDGPDGNAYEQVPPEQAQDQEPAFPIIGEMARLLRDIRGSLLASAGVLAAITIGIALEVRFATRSMQPGAFRVIDIGLLLGLMFCWLMAAGLLVRAGSPVLNAVSELRWRTGAPLDPRAGWLTLPPVGTQQEEWAWTRAHLLLGAARLARYRAHCAGTWTYVTACYFLVWTVIIIVGA